MIRESLRYLLPLITVLSLSSCDPTIKGTLIFEKGTMETVTIEFYENTNRGSDSVRFYRLEETVELDEVQPIYERQDSRLGSGTVGLGEIIASDSVVFKFNNERSLSFPDGTEPRNMGRNILIYDEGWYDISGDNEDITYTKTFTQQDYEDAEEF